MILNKQRPSVAQKCGWVNFKNMRLTPEKYLSKIKANQSEYTHEEVVKILRDYSGSEGMEIIPYRSLKDAIIDVYGTPTAAIRRLKVSKAVMYKYFKNPEIMKLREIRKMHRDGLEVFRIVNMEGAE